MYQSVLLSSLIVFFLFFFFNDTATTEIYTLSLHDALPIRKCRAAWARLSNDASNRYVIFGIRRLRKFWPTWMRGWRQLGAKPGSGLPPPRQCCYWSEPKL